MMNNMKIEILILATVIVVISFGLTQYMKQAIFKKLLRNLQQGNFDVYFKTLDSFWCKYFYPVFNREYMRLNAYMMKGDKEKVEECFAILLRIRKAKKQELDIAIKAFYYYLDEENKRKCKELLQIIKKSENEAVLNECQIIFDIFLCKETKYIEMMEEQLKDTTCTGLNRGMFDFMLGLQYGYRKEHEKEMAHLQAAKKELKDTPYMKKIDDLLG